MEQDAFCANDGAILTYSGKLISLFQPQVEKINIEDIAHGLSNLCRFGGQVSKFYSVAEHCVHASYLVEPRLQLCALLHDATEAYLIDLPRPIKLQLPQYKNFEDNLAETIYARFNVECNLLPEIKNADNYMLTVEAYNLMKQDGEFQWPLCENKNMKLFCWTPEQAKEAYLNRYVALTGDVNVLR